MSADRRSLAWATKYQELLAGFVEALGGDNIPPAKRAIAKTIATLSTELSMLSDRFAATQGGSPEDIALYLKISGTITGLLEAVGLAQSLQKPPPDLCGRDANGAVAALTAALDSIIRTRAEEEAEGLFRDRDGTTIITNPERLAIEQQIRALELQREALPATAPTDGTLAAKPPPPPDLKVVSAAPPPRRTVISTIPGVCAVALEGLDGELSTTDKFLRWPGHSRT